MQKWNKAIQGGSGGGLGAALAQLIILMGWVPVNAEAALTIVLAGVLGALGPALLAANK